MKPKLKYLLVLFSLIVVVSCIKPEPLPEEPSIEFMQFEKMLNEAASSDTLLVYSRGVLTFSFVDGDGDLGYDSTASDFVNPNLLINYYEIRNGDTVKTLLLFYDIVNQQYDTTTFNGTLPNLTPYYGAPTAIEGEISDTLFIDDPSSEYDTILFKVRVIDRAGNISNEITTPQIVRRIHF